MPSSFQSSKTIPSQAPLPFMAPAPWWLGGRLRSRFSGHMQTIWTALYAQAFDERPHYRRERWATPDNDFIDIDWLAQDAEVIKNAQSVPQQNTHCPNKPLMVLFHGLEGSSESSYALALARWCQQQEWSYAVVNFRSCSGEINLAPRLYHMSDYKEADWVLKRFRAQHLGPIYAVGVSLGANTLLRWLVEAGEQAQKMLEKAVSVCAPLDLVSNARVMDKGFCKAVYTKHFLHTMRPKMEQKFKQHPNLFDINALRKSKTFAEFDSVITAPLHGFKSALEYWTNCSITAPMLKSIHAPTLIINPLNDPFIPTVIAPERVSNKNIRLLYPTSGGHLGFVSGSFPGNLQSFAHTIGNHLQANNGC